MAQFDLTNEGVNEMENLRTRIKSATEEILLSTDKMISTIDGLESEVGIYALPIYKVAKLIVTIVTSAKDGEEGLDALTEKYIPEMVEKMVRLIQMVEFNTNENDIHKTR